MARKSRCKTSQNTSKTTRKKESSTSSDAPSSHFMIYFSKQVKSRKSSSTVQHQPKQLRLVSESHLSHLRHVNNLFVMLFNFNSSLLCAFCFSTPALYTYKQLRGAQKQEKRDLLYSTIKGIEKLSSVNINQ